jgi:hypothetical protein
LQEARAERLRKTERDQQRERHIGDAAKSKAEKERDASSARPPRGRAPTIRTRIMTGPQPPPRPPSHSRRDGSGCEFRVTPLGRGPPGPLIVMGADFPVWPDLKSPHATGRRSGGKPDFCH